MTLSSKQIYGIITVLVAGGGGMFLAASAGPYVILVAIIAAIAIAVSAQGGGGPMPALGNLADAAKRAAAGERIAPPAGSPVEIARLYDELANVSEQRKKDLLETAERKAELEQIERSVEDALKRMADSVQTQAGAADETTKNIKDLASAIREIAQHIEALTQSAEESSSSILEMTATNDEVAENVGELAGSVRETVSSIEEMAYSIKEVAKNVDALSLTAEETSSSMNEMDVSIDQVQSNANETARLSEEVALDAEKGAEAILKTISEIYRIKESSQEAVSVISNLGSRIEAIGQIVTE